ncbi:hypothetical protein [Algoriphagus formosus]|uniref:hypothetical protein n=1 Tax=Algoriphagus formosus TaxID=2007308 RepID=UPI00140436B0|nr:hypothetical protein [Algoriphagus aquimaris]
MATSKMLQNSHLWVKDMLGIENVLICHKDKDYIFLALLGRKKDEVDRLEPSGF